MKYELTLTLTHKSFDAPIIHRDIIQAASRSMATRHFKLSGAQIANLKRFGEIEWIDHREVTHVLSLKEEN